MTVSTFKKREPTELLVPKGQVVLLNSDADGKFPMTTSETKNGQVLCRWHDDVGNLQGDWFFIEELCVPADDEVVGFEAEFALDAQESDK